LDSDARVARAAEWLDSLELHDPRDDALRRVGLELTAAFVRRKSPRLPIVATTTLPTLAQLVTMERDGLVGFCNRIARSVAVEWPGSEEPRRWQAVLPGLCISYARDADPVAVASLIRVAVRLHMDTAPFDEAIAFLLEQQADDGSFGLLSDSEQIGDGRLRQSLRITVEVIWALAAVASEWPPPICGSL
jgi:hypothetical protein